MRHKLNLARLEELRIDRRLTRPALADAAGMTSNDISAFYVRSARGHLVYERTIWRLADALGVPESELIVPPAPVKGKKKVASVCGG